MTRTNPITPIDELPDLDWSDTAKQEIERLGAGDLLRQSSVAYRIRHVAVAGLIYHSFLQPPWFWFALAKDISHGDLLDFRRLKDLIPKGSLTGVNKADARCVRFAQLYGFEPTAEEHEQQGVTYQVFRRA